MNTAKINAKISATFVQTFKLIPVMEITKDEARVLAQALRQSMFELNNSTNLNMLAAFQSLINDLQNFADPEPNIDTVQNWHQLMISFSVLKQKEQSQ